MMFPCEMIGSTVEVITWQLQVHSDAKRCAVVGRFDDDLTCDHAFVEPSQLINQLHDEQPHLR